MPRWLLDVQIPWFIFAGHVRARQLLGLTLAVWYFSEPGSRRPWGLPAENCSDHPSTRDPDMRFSLVPIFLAFGLFVVGSEISKGVDESRVGTQQQQAAPEDRDRGPGREIPPDEGDPGTGEVQPRVAPEYFPPGRDGYRFRRPQWWLGIYATNTPTGVVVTRVVPGSPASRAGLEQNDRIVSVNGYQVGYVTQRFYPLGEELQRRAGPRGDVTLLVQNWRNNRLLNIDVRMQEEGRGDLRDRPVRPFGREESEESEESLESESQARTLPFPIGPPAPPAEPRAREDGSDL
jgi:hypothetical protein